MQLRIVSMLFFMAAGAVAQWLAYPMAGIPRTRDGKPNLAAPAPKTRDGKPDFSGLWVPEDDPTIKGTNGEHLPRLFIDIGRGLKPGEFAMQPWAEALLRERDKNFQADDPLTQCKPVGVPRLDAIPIPIKILQQPGLIVFLHEQEQAFRQIHTDGRKLPEDPQPATFGWSVGRFEGGALVVETVGFHEGGWLDARGHPHSEALHVTERFRRRDFGHMEVAITIDDPKAYQKPFTNTQPMVFVADSDLLEYLCSENERDVRHFTK